MFLTDGSFDWVLLAMHVEAFIQLNNVLVCTFPGGASLTCIAVFTFVVETDAHTEENGG